MDKPLIVSTDIAEPRVGSDGAPMKPYYPIIELPVGGVQGVEYEPGDLITLRIHGKVIESRRRVSGEQKERKRQYYTVEIHEVESSVPNMADRTLKRELGL